MISMIVKVQRKIQPMMNIMLYGMGNVSLSNAANNFTKPRIGVETIVMSNMEQSSCPSTKKKARMSEWPLSICSPVALLAGLIVAREMSLSAQPSRDYNGSRQN